MTCFANKPDEVYSPLAQLLLDQGAVLYCKTNVPQTMMTADSDNNVFGRTINPANTKITAGGSSGGEGALIAMRGSILGVGTDVAGSIRIPSLCNGIYGLRTSVGLVPFADQKDPVAPGTDGIAAVAGPMATSLRSCDLFMKTLSAAEVWKYDDSCLHLNRWDTCLKHTNLRIGVAHNDGMFTPWPPVRRAMQETATRLRASGIELVELDMPDISEAISVTYRMFSLDGCEVRIIDHVMKLECADIAEVRPRSNRAGRRARSRICQAHQSCKHSRSHTARLLRAERCKIPIEGCIPAVLATQPH
jgi:amidase